MSSLKKAKKLVNTLKKMPADSETEFWIAAWLDEQVRNERQECVESIQLVIEAADQFNLPTEIKQGCELARGAVEIRFYDEDEENI